ncbi:hypothetical protein [Pontivivens nitratireducens]|uniref:Uncharacterized protein n=1 Tax=Pontivivens nitratireducens TaxID=2758038 RepID=A0A6G7VNF6_9RHOB|nr:hypothetical protein [Pontibrevibacter nitratireducens]QIK41327.1 hypothetical protein G8E03_11420 [Pontibrevibacter nitratireducens]
MNDIEALEARIQAATTRIATAIAAKQNVAAEPGGDPVALRRLERVNVALRAQLKDMELKREADMAQLDGLISELRPLVEEAENG